MSNIELFCLPYSGGSAAMYYKWRPFLAKHITLKPLEPAGRGAKIRDPLSETMQESVMFLYQQFIKQYQGGEYAIYGHSLGGLIAFELAHHLIEQGYPMPSVLFFSGCRPPDLTEDDKSLHKKADDEFIQEIFKLGGTSTEFIKNKELLRLFTPIIKSDYRLYEEYRYQAKTRQFTCPLVVLVADNDSLVPLDLSSGWQQFTNKPVEMNVFENANHFFVDQYFHKVISVINHAVSH